jgi:hypothetical protein
MNLSRLDDLAASERTIRTCIESYGFAPEHSYESFVDSAEEGWSGAFFMNDEGYGLMAYHIKKDNEWMVLVDAVAPEAGRAQIFFSFLTYALIEAKAEAAYVQCLSETRKELVRLARPTLRLRRTSEKFMWPVLDLKTYDPSLLGPRMKPLRNVLNRFSREHTLELVLPSSLPKAPLHAIVDLWKKNRPAKHRAYAAEYHTLIDEDFRGTEGALVFVVDGKPEAISASWPIPNSRGLYHSVALHTYAHWGLGEILMLKSLEQMKRSTYDFVNLGGSDANLLSFKQKFGNTEIYTTEYFSVVRA